MLDFVSIKTHTKLATRKTDIPVVTIYPEFTVKPSEDLMIRGESFYAVWDEEASMWSTDKSTVARIVDKAILEKACEFPEEANCELKLMRDFSSKKWSEFLAYANSLPDSYHELDEMVTFADEEVAKGDYRSKRLPYSLKAGDTPAYDEIMETLYDPDERRKIEWAIGSVMAGESHMIQKFIVLYGAAGSGKSTVLNIIQMLFPGYFSVFDAKALASSSNAFALESLRSNPLVAIQHDGDLSRIEDNTKINSIVSHEKMVVNEKRKSMYESSFRSFLFMGTNKPVKITDAKSGITRRLIDVRPSGRLLPFERYQLLMAQVNFELGGIAAKCMDLYFQYGPSAYDAYRPLEMMSATNDFYNFVEDQYDIFQAQDGTTLKQAWAMYKVYADDADLKYPYSERKFKEELKNYFAQFSLRTTDPTDGKQKRNVYRGFLTDKFTFAGEPTAFTSKPSKTSGFIELASQESVFDKMYANCPAQYATKGGKPKCRWNDNPDILRDIDTSQLHYVKVPKEHIVIDFDLVGEDGEKSLERNLAAASKWPTTYTELSKSGKGVHLHYIYNGDVEQLANVYSDKIEIKTFGGNASLRRKLSLCNDKPISTISSGLPLKKGGKMVDFEGLKNEKAIRTLIKKNLRKEIHPGTKPSVDFIKKILDDAYESGMHYDVTDMRNDILAFAGQSTHHSRTCIRTVSEMKFHSEEVSEGEEWDENLLIFYDVEVFPNLFVVVWKRRGSSTPAKLVNPTPSEVEELVRFKLVGFNCRRYDNHILYARLLGYTNAQLYNLSQKIITGSANAMFREAYNLSFADVYDFASKKQSLKKWEIELGIHHQELGLPWNEPVPENLWDKVAEYCVNDVVATEAVFEARQDDFKARELLADLSGHKVNDTTRMHATRIIFGDDRSPQSKFVYTDLGKELFPGYTFEAGHSQYRGEDPGEGGYVYSEPGIYYDVALLDVASMHPTSLIELNLFGPYTKKFEELVQARLAIKHQDYDKAAKMLNGKLAGYLGSKEDSDKLAYALKIIINSIYGFTSARFDCEFKDPRNIDNIVAKRGALFMIDLKNAVQEKGFTVAHIKTDSIKIPEATPDIIQFVIDFGKKYGYTFEHEATYDRMCLVNDAVYIARTDSGKWTATGAQFAVPYVFKTLFSKEELIFSDYCETKTVSGDSAIFLDFNEDEPDKHNYRFVGRAGQFTPVQPGKGGGILLRCKDEKYYAVTGTKGFRWKESEMVRILRLDNEIDIGYYDKLCDAAVKTIEQFGSFEEFVKEK